MLRNLLDDSGDISDETNSHPSHKLGGMLTFEDPRDCDAVTSPYTGSTSLLSFDSESSHSSSCASIDSRRPTGTKVIFEIVSARTLNSLRKKYVAYTLLIKRSPGLDNFPAVVERRYSEFLELFVTLKRRFPEELQKVNYFPHKTVIGNFKPEVITHRSRAFEQFLYHVYNSDSLRLSLELANFFYNRDIKKARSLMQCGQFEDAIPIMENVYFIQDKILGENDMQTISTLCEVIALYNAIDNVAEAHKFAEIALRQFEAGRHEKSELYPSLLQLMIRLCWNLGKEKRDLERQLHELVHNNSIRVENLPTLLDIVMRKCK